MNALSATTANVIQGTAPYLTFDNGVTKAKTTEELLGITLSDGTKYTQTNSSTISNPIVLPVEGEVMSDIAMFVPSSVNSIGLTALIGAPYNYWSDDDGDGQGIGGITASGTLSVKITDVSGKTVGRSDTLSGCNAPYKLVLTSTSGNLKTKYGKPNVTNFSGGSAIYYIKPKVVPTVCYAQPNLVYGTGVYQGNAQWNSSKGFKIADLNTPSSNFPTTGSNGLSFNLNISGATAQSVIDTMGVTVKKGNVTLFLSVQSTNVLNVKLLGPKEGDNGSSLSFSPATFKLKTGLTEIYSFTIRQWFIAKSGTTFIDHTTAGIFCNSTINNGYRVPSVADYTNDTSYYTNYKRVVGGGLFAEWGYTSNNQTLYSDSVWKTQPYWTSKTNGTHAYAVYSDSGGVGTDFIYRTVALAACVSP